MLVQEGDKIYSREARTLPLVIWPDVLLHEISEPVEQFATEDLYQLVADMLLSMRVNKGCGLSAPQIGSLQRVVVLEVVQGERRYYINPVVDDFSVEQFLFNEGCLSVPGYFEMRERPKFITVRYKDVANIQHEEKLEGLHAFAMLHEIDHLNGNVFVDNLSDLKQQLVRKKIVKTLRRS